MLHWALHLSGLWKISLFCSSATGDLLAKFLIFSAQTDQIQKFFTRCLRIAITLNDVGHFRSRLAQKFEKTTIFSWTRRSSFWQPCRNIFARCRKKAMLKVFFKKNPSKSSPWHADRKFDNLAKFFCQQSESSFKAIFFPRKSSSVLKMFPGKKTEKSNKN